ncbi:MAG: hypothetical protein ABSH46_06020 [Bryobacteraceae bacterium]
MKLALDGLDSVETDLDFVADRELAAGALADDLVRVLVEAVAVAARRRTLRRRDGFSSSVAWKLKFMRRLGDDRA